MRSRLWPKALLVLLTLLYPGAHFVLHRAAGTDPWTLGGYAMYTLPRPKTALLVHSDGRVLDATALCPQTAVDYVSFRMAVGRFAGDAPLRACLRERGLSGKALWLAERRFDGASGRFVTTKHRLGAPL